MKKYENQVLVIPAKDMKMFCYAWARYSQVIQPELDEQEVRELMEAFFESHPITVSSLFYLAEIIQATRFVPGKDTWQ